MSVTENESLHNGPKHIVMGYDLIYLDLYLCSSELQTWHSFGHACTMLTEGRGGEFIKGLLYMPNSVRPSRFYINLNFHSFIKISSPNCQGMFMGTKTCLWKILALF